MLAALFSRAIEKMAKTRTQREKMNEEERETWIVSTSSTAQKEPVDSLAKGNEERARHVPHTIGLCPCWKIKRTKKKKKKGGRSVVACCLVASIEASRAQHASTNTRDAHTHTHTRSARSQTSVYTPVAHLVFSLLTTLDTICLCVCRLAVCTTNPHFHGRCATWPAEILFEVHRDWQSKRRRRRRGANGWKFFICHQVWHVYTVQLAKTFTQQNRKGGEVWQSTQLFIPTMTNSISNYF